MLSSLQSLKVLLKYRWRRFLTTLERMAAFGQNSKTTARTGTARARGLSGFFVVVMIVGYPLMAFVQSYNVLDNLLPKLRYHLELEDGTKFSKADQLCTEPGEHSFRAKFPGQKDYRQFRYFCVASDTAPHQIIPEAVQRSVALQLALLVLAAIVSGIATREIAAPEWDLEWLVTMPVPLKALIDARIIQKSVINPLAILLIWPFATMFLWHLLDSALAIPLGMLMALPLLLIAGCVQTLIDTGLRIVTNPGSTRNIQALVASMFPLALVAAMSPMLSDLSLIPDAAELLPSWGAWSPFELVIAVFTATDFSFALLRAALLAGELYLIYGLCSWLLAKLLGRGVVAGSGWQRVHPPVTAGPQRRSWLGSTWFGSTWLGSFSLGPMARKELTLLWRDKNYLIQAFLVPLLAFGAQLWLTGAGAKLTTGPLSYGLVAIFVYVCYMLTLTAVQVIGSERQALWLLHTVPASLAATISAKLRLWGGVGLCFCAALIALRLGLAPIAESILEAVALCAVTVAGVVIYTVIAGSIGILSSDVLADDPRKRLSFAATFAFMNLTGFYVYALISSSLHTSSVIVLLAVLLAYALWQKATARLPYLLDASSAPPPAVAVADGLMAVYGFFVLQSLIVAAIAFADGKIDIASAELMGIKGAYWGFAGAGALICGVFIWRFRRQGAAFQPRLLGPGGIPAAFRVALPLAALACGVAAGYRELLARYGWFSEQVGASPVADGLWQNLAIMVFAAPVVEEYIFRGLLFASLARSLEQRWEKGRGMALAMVASAILFALMHPLPALAPVAILGLITAYGYQRTGALAAPILIHALYNGAVIGYALLSG